MVRPSPPGRTGRRPLVRTGPDRGGATQVNRPGRDSGHNGRRRRATDHEEADVSAPRRPDSPADPQGDTEPALPAGMLEALYSRPSRARTALVVVLLLAGLAVAAYVGSTLVWPGDDEPAASSTTGTDATGVTCWNGDVKTDERSCVLPTGRAGLEHVFPSFDPEQQTCRDELVENPQFKRPAMWTCDVELAAPVSITYSQVSGAKAARRYFGDLHGVEPVKDRSSSGVRRDRWRTSEVDGAKNPRLWSGSVLVRGAPYAVTVTAQRRADVGRALDRRVQMRPLEELRVAAPDSSAQG